MGHSNEGTSMYSKHIHVRVIRMCSMTSFGFLTLKSAPIPFFSLTVYVQVILRGRIASQITPDGP